MNWDKSLLFGKLDLGLGSAGEGNGERGKETGPSLTEPWGSSGTDGRAKGGEALGYSLS